jgi:hypothetical protein
VHLLLLPFTSRDLVMIGDDENEKKKKGRESTCLTRKIATLLRRHVASVL